MRSVQTSSPEVFRKSLTPEHALGAAILRQAWKDMRSPVVHIRHEARAFFADAQAVAWWDDLLGCGGLLVRKAQAVQP